MEKTRINGINDAAGYLFANTDSFHFHVVLKGLLRQFLPFVTIPERWMEDLDHNSRVLYAIYRDHYLQHEKQAWRRQVLEKVLPFAIALRSYDPNYREVGDKLLKEIGEAYVAGKFEFPENHLDPDRWYQDGRGRTYEPD